MFTDDHAPHAIGAYDGFLKLMHFYQFGNEWELYDLKTDPDELTNLYGKDGHADLTKVNPVDSLSGRYND